MLIMVVLHVIDVINTLTHSQIYPSIPRVAKGYICLECAAKIK